MEGIPIGGSIMLKPNRPEPYSGRRDYLTAIGVEKSLPAEKRILLNGKIQGHEVEVLKYDGCNTNVVS